MAVQSSRKAITMTKDNKRIKHWLSVIMVLLWMACIFFFSAQVAESSNGLSLGLAEKLYGFVIRWISVEKLPLDLFNHYIRKLAHFAIYGVLGILLSYAYFKNQWMMGKRQWLYIWLTGTVYAMTDELHQFFVPGRAMQFRDVLIDSGGCLAGILAFTVLRLLVGLFAGREV